MKLSRASVLLHNQLDLLNLYAFFHLNLMFSSVEEGRRKQIIERCYWPLLQLARCYDLPLGIEAPACTLEFIQAIDPSWIVELRELIHHGPCEFIGSGYTQLIGPIVPARVNQANLQLGMESYEALLDIRPSIALVNEQAYSAGLVPHYLDAGFEALIMEWNNPFRSNPAWDPEWCYHPQRAVGVDCSSIQLIWNKSIAFQKFQRYAHSELDLPEFLTYLRSHCSSTPRCFPLYGSDAEIFDFRPGRFLTEASLQCGEWERIKLLVEALQSDHSFRWIAPSAVCQNTQSTLANHELKLESVDQPIPVKKQGKYNILRWAVTGRHDLDINTRCHRLHQSLAASPSTNDEDWKELCFLWSSDFRTHITSSRWERYQSRLMAFEKKWPFDKRSFLPSYSKSHNRPTVPLTWSHEGRWLTASTEHLEVRFNCRRGLAIEYFMDKRLSSMPLFGTLHHGHFDDITWGADFYSGHLVFQTLGAHQITDLQYVEPCIQTEGDCLVISAKISTPLGPIHKTWNLNAEKHTLVCSVQLDWPEAGPGRLRLVPFTLFSEIYNHDTLHVSAANGGDHHELFRLNDKSFDHGQAVSFLVSANQGLGLTDGFLRIGDTDKAIALHFNPAFAALVGQIQHQHIKNQWFTRLSLSARELDDTAQSICGLTLECSFEISTSIGRV